MTEQQKDRLWLIVGWVFIIAVEIGWWVFLFYFYDVLFPLPVNEP